MEISTGKNTYIYWKNRKAYLKLQNYGDSVCGSAGRDPSLLDKAFLAVAEKEASSQEALQVVAAEVKQARVMVVSKR
jgi:hypothetical protein